MANSSEEILDIYRVMKKKRIVLTQDEFAKILGISRGYLSKTIKDGGVPADWIQTAKNYLADNDKNAKFVIKNVEQEIRDLVEENIRLRAEVNVLRVTVLHISADVKGTEVALVSGQISQAVEMEVDRLFGIRAKKHS